MRLLLLLTFLLLAAPAWAQVPAGQWDASSAGDSDYSDIQRAVVDADGNVIVLGQLVGAEATFGATRLRKVGKAGKPGDAGEAFVAKLSAAGQWQWAAQASHTVPAEHDYHPSHRTRDDETEVNALAVGRGRRFYLGGRYERGLTLTPRRWVAKRRPPLPDAGAFVAGLSPKGRWRWILAAPEIHYPQLGPDACVGLATAPASGDVLAVGTVNDSTAFDRATPIGQHGDNAVANPVGVGPKGEVYVAGSASGGRMRNSDGEVRHCFIARLCPAFVVGSRAAR